MVYLVSRLRQVVIYLFNDHVAEQAVVGVAASKARIAAAEARPLGRAPLPRARSAAADKAAAEPEMRET